MGIYFNDAPMRCCGLIEGYGFDEAVVTGEKKQVQDYFSTGGSRTVSVTRPPTQQDTEDRLTELIRQSSYNQRNCVMIVLSDDQKSHIEVAERLGFRKIQSFWNPNSGNNCHIMTYLNYESSDDYDGEWD